MLQISYFLSCNTFTDRNFFRREAEVKCTVWKDVSNRDRTAAADEREC